MRVGLLVCLEASLASPCLVGGDEYQRFVILVIESDG